jgi:diacylglycerol kinase (ATP)
MSMRSYTALVNPISGGGHAVERLSPVAELLRARGAAVTIVETTSRDHAIDRAADAAAHGRVVLAAGGDGLVRDAAQGVVSAAGVLGIVPAGRGNDLATALHVPDEPVALATLLLDAEPRTIDVLECAGRVVPGNVYVGLDSVATEMINSSRWIPGPILYRLAPVRAALTWRAARFTVTVDGVEHTLRGHSVVVANSGAYGQGLRIVPHAAVDDGVLDVLIIGDLPHRKIARFMRAAAHGDHLRYPKMTVLTGREVVVAADRDLPVGMDGDGLSRLPTTVRVRPRALRTLVP